MPSFHPFRVAQLSYWPAVCSSLAAAFLAGCAKEEVGDEGIGTPQVLHVNSFQQSWNEQIEIGHGPINRLFLRDTMLFGYTDDGTSFVMDRATGHQPYPGTTVRHGSEALHGPVVLKDYIVYPTNTSLEIYDHKGNLLLSKEMKYSIRSEAVGNRTYVYFGADALNGGRLVSVDIASQYLDHRWELMFPQSAVASAPAIFGDIVYCAAGNGDVTAVAFDSREPVWPTDNGIFKTYGEVVGDLAIDETGLYVASTDGKLCCLNRNNGKVKWQYLSAHELREAPVVTKDLVFQHVPTIGMVAIDKIPLVPFNRGPKWHASDIVKILSEDDKNVYALREDDVIVALDKTNGHALFTSHRHDLIAYTTNIKDGTIYTVKRANRVMAIMPVLKRGTIGEMAWEPVTNDRQALAVAR